MSLINDIEQAALKAMKEKNETALPVLRMLKSSLKNKVIELIKKELTDAEVMAVIRSEIKKRKDSIDAYRQGGRQDLADTEQAEISVLEKFLPAQLDPETIRVKAREVIAGLAEEDRANFGKAMKQVMAALGGQADGAAVSAAVKEILAAENKN